VEEITEISGPAACWAGEQDTSGQRPIGLEAVTTGIAYPKANRTAQWYAGSYPGIYMGGIEKVLLHTTETGTWPGYGGGASMPNLTFFPKTLEWRQHQWCDWSARALRDPTSTVVQENRDKVCQIEIIACSDLAWADKYGYLRVTRISDAAIKELGTFIRWTNITFGVPLVKAPIWLSYPSSAGDSAARMSGPTFDAFRGVCGHMHASGNTHGDPDSIPIDKIMAAAGATPIPPSTFTLTTADQIWLTTNFARSVNG